MPQAHLALASLVALVGAGCGVLVGETFDDRGARPGPATEGGDTTRSPGPSEPGDSLLHGNNLGKVRDVDVSDSLVCAVRKDSGALACSEEGQPLPSGVFRSIALDAVYGSCAIREDGTLACWATENGVEPTSTAGAPSGPVSAVVTGPASCAIKDGAVLCWGRRDVDLEGFVNVRDIAFAGGTLCGLLEDGRLMCSGRSVPSPTARVRAIGRGGGFCYIDATSSRPSCWSYVLTQTKAEWVARHAPDVALQSVSIAHVADVACGVGEAGAITCWRPGLEFTLSEPTAKVTAALLDNVPSGSFRKVVLGSRVACAIRTDDELVCWGSDPLLDW